MGGRNPRRHKTAGREAGQTHQHHILIKIVKSITKRADFLVCRAAHPSHPPVVVVFIFISWLNERKGAIITGHVAGETYQHLQTQLKERKMKTRTREVSIETKRDKRVISLFREEDGRQRRRSC